MTVRRDGVLKSWTYTEYLKDIVNAAKAFLSLGLERHRGVGIWGFNSPEWFMADIAAIFSGGIVRAPCFSNNISKKKKYNL
jgi:long-chain-fatty-acid--CoA ligase ACSBG